MFIIGITTFVIGWVTALWLERKHRHVRFIAYMLLQVVALTAIITGLTTVLVSLLPKP